MYAAAEAVVSTEHRKLALVIGNNNYTESPLTNCVNDAIDLSNQLAKVGFRVRIEVDANYEDMDNGIKKFMNRIMPDDFVLFFFAGHGVQWEKQNYLIPCDDNLIREFIDLKHQAMNAQRVLELISAKNPFAILFFLDCCRSYWLPSLPRSITSADLSIGMAPMSALADSLIVFACAPEKTAVEITSSNGRNGVFTYHLLQHLLTPGENITIVMIDVTHAVAKETRNKQIPYTISALRRPDVYLIPPEIQQANQEDTGSNLLRSNTRSTKKLAFNIPANARWTQNGVTVAGGHGEGNAINQLDRPFGLFVDDDETIVIADAWNYRVVQWKKDDTNGQVVAGGHGLGCRLDQLHFPTDLLIDKETNSLIISEWHNQRVVRWSRCSGTTQGEILLEGIDCFGIAMDNQRCLYVSDFEKHEVRRYQMGETKGIIVAGGHGRGDGLNQLHWPTYIFVDRQKTVYVSDYKNHRVIKWHKDAKEGIVVAGGQGTGQTMAHLMYPKGLFVDAWDTIYVADAGNGRVMSWHNGAKQGTIIVGGNGEGEGANQLSNPWGLSLDQHGNLYVVDHGNDRVQRYSIE
ncbi:unnamed protein product [Rotaria sp. Silwood2]|nr:unnamed protein product [Rotaria sp. Silwood2]